MLRNYSISCCNPSQLSQNLVFVFLFSQTDVLLCMLLMIITFGLVAISMFGMFYLTTSPGSPRSRVSRYWTETAVGVFLGIVVKCIIAGRDVLWYEHFNYKPASEDELFACLHAAVRCLLTVRLSWCKVNGLLTWTEQRKSFAENEKKILGSGMCK